MEEKQHYTYLFTIKLTTLFFDYFLCLMNCDIGVTMLFSIVRMRHRSYNVVFYSKNAT